MKGSENKRIQLKGSCNFVVLGQYNLVLIGIEWYWVNKGLLCLYIYIEKINGDVDRPTNQQGEYRAICLF